jgi:tetratricopeptide (TPR) repeat protein
MRVISCGPIDRDRGRTSGGGRWLRRPVWRACGLAVLAALAVVPTARAGTVVLPLEWVEKNGIPGAEGAAAQGPVELDQATKSFQAGDFETCLKQLGQAVLAHPDLPPAHALFAELASRNNQLALMRPALERAFGEDPAHPQVFVLFGDLALREGRWTDAALHFEKATALASTPRWTSPKRDHFERLCLRARAAVAEGRGDWKAAKSALDDRLKLEPADAPARQRLGKALFRLDQWDAAYRELERAAREDATLEPAAISMAWLYTAAGDIKKAEEWLDYAVKSAPDSLGVRIGRASWLLEQGRVEDARAEGEAAARIDPRSRDARRLVGLAARARNDLAGAQTILEALDRESPGDAWTSNQLAVVLAEQADDAQRRRALELAEGLVRRAPNDADALATLGTVCYRLHRLEEAEKLLQTVLASGRASSETAYILARVHVDRGHPEAAPALLDAALSTPGIFVFRNDARQWRNRLALASRSAPRR